VAVHDLEEVIEPLRTQHPSVFVVSALWYLPCNIVVRMKDSK
jgi:hypothetical protein